MPRHDVGADPYLGKQFKIRLDLGSFGSEHTNRAIAPHNGAVCTLVAEVRPGLYQTDIAVEGPDSDYVHEGKLLVMPSKDGKVVGGRARSKPKETP